MKRQWNGSWSPLLEIARPISPVVHLWTESLSVSETELARFGAYLDRDELQRAGRFKFPVHRARFIAGRGMVRAILARYLRCEPAEMQFEHSSFGKPSLRSGAVQFNVAHSEDRLLLAVSDQPIGVDIEILRPIPEIESLAAQVFTPEELVGWNKPDHKSFLRLWTRKEALLKALGVGIAHHVKDVSVFFDDKSPIGVPATLSTEEWTIETFESEDEIWSIAVPFRSPEFFFCQQEFRTVRDK